MTDSKKFKILTALATGLIVLILSYNILREYIIPDMENYIRRRIYYEQVISKKLDLHKGMHWREKQ